MSPKSGPKSSPSDVSPKVSLLAADIMCPDTALEVGFSALRIEGKNEHWKHQRRRSCRGQLEARRSHGCPGRDGRTRRRRDRSPRDRLVQGSASRTGEADAPDSHGAGSSDALAASRPQESKGVVTARSTASMGPCVVCGSPTSNRTGAKKPNSEAWSWRAWRCADVSRCAARRDARRQR